MSHPTLLVVGNPWYIVASVAFCASNKYDEVPRVFQHALKDLKAESDNIEDHRLLARKVRDALFKAGLTAGFARVGFRCVQDIS